MEINQETRGGDRNGWTVECWHCRGVGACDCNEIWQAHQLDLGLRPARRQYEWKNPNAMLVTW